MKRSIFSFAALVMSAVALAAPAAPLGDHHQHLFSPTMATLLTGSTDNPQPIFASAVIGLLDAAGIRRALVLSVAYIYGSPARTVEDEYAKVRAENDWTAAQAAQYSDRLRGFCGFNPLKDYALDELDRCAKHPHLSRGIKLHFGNSDVQLDDPADAERLRSVFRAANDRRMAIVVHLRASISRKRPYGVTEARRFIELLSWAPDVPVQIAHLAGAGPGYDDPAAHDVMTALAEAIEQGDPRMARVWFDVATIVDADISSVNAALVATRIRQVGIDRVLYGSDAAAGSNLRPAEAWAAFRKLPLSEVEFSRIAGNVAPYLH